MSARRPTVRRRAGRAPRSAKLSQAGCCRAVAVQWTVHQTTIATTSTAISPHSRLQSRKHASAAGVVSWMSRHAPAISSDGCAGSWPRCGHHAYILLTSDAGDVGRRIGSCRMRSAVGAGLHPGLRFYPPSRSSR